ncbi:MAG: hypothetical protein QOK23_4252, partial [Gammaproteobacteria bacterium]|nr:hypothetical protein [Gammaproteobacteria bacterium]
MNSEGAGALKCGPVPGADSRNAIAADIVKPCPWGVSNTNTHLLFTLGCWNGPASGRSIPIWTGRAEQPVLGRAVQNT